MTLTYQRTRDGRLVAALCRKAPYRDLDERIPESRQGVELVEGVR